MAWLLKSSSTPTYAEETLSHQLSSISTLPVSLSSSNTFSSSSSSSVNPNLAEALHKLSSTSSLPRHELVSVLQSLSKDKKGQMSSLSSLGDEAVEAEIIGRAVTMVWKEVIQALIGSAISLQEEKSWWMSTLNSRREVLYYLLQTLPLRMYKAIESQPHSLSLQNFKFPSRDSLFISMPNASKALTSITSPYTLTRREMLNSIKSLSHSKDSMAIRIGVLASECPNWYNVHSSGSNEFQSEISRIYSSLCSVLEIPIGPATPRKGTTNSKSHGNSYNISTSSTSSTGGFVSTNANPSSLLSILTVHLPKLQESTNTTLKRHGRPKLIVRIWFPLLFLPPVLLIGGRMLSRNKEWFAQQIRNSKETVKGFFVGWVWEPLEGVAKTLRGGGEGLGVSQTTVKSDQEVSFSRKGGEVLENELEEVPEKPWKPARWGDAALGKWNNGVNGEEGLGGGFERGYDVVELGAGALRKTAHLLTALANAVPENPSGAAPITYHPLDLSHPELHRVLGEMNDAFGKQLSGKVECIGLHGDYNAGLQFIKDGKLSSLKDTMNITRNPTVSGTEPMMVPVKDRKASDTGFAGSPADTLLVTPSIDMISLPSGQSEPSVITEESESDGIDGSKVFSQPSESDDVSIDETGDRPLHFVFLGSSIGNFSRESAGPFLASLPLRPGDTLLVGLDGRPTPGPEGSEKVRVAYNDPSGYTRAFEEHGWDVVRQELGLKDDAGVEFVGRYNEVLGRHESYFRSKAKQSIHLPDSGTEVVLEEDELLNIEWSYKLLFIADFDQYSLSEALNLFDESNLRVIDSWKASTSEYRLWLLERPSVMFNSVSQPTQEDICEMELLPPNQEITKEVKGLPTWAEWQAVWKLWDHISLEMIPEEMLHTKPIDLRHICLFYLGHIPTFLDIYLTNLTGGNHSDPQNFKDIFERGIDPDVDDPTKCHVSHVAPIFLPKLIKQDHSEVPVDPSDWPALGEILGFRDRVRLRLRNIYNSLNKGEMKLTRRAARMIFMTYEHEFMHAETLLYMLIQSPTTIPPSAVAKPQWDILAEKWKKEKCQNEVLHIKGREIVLGHDDVEADDEKFESLEEWKNHEFGWDNENPSLKVSVGDFKIDSLPITNKEYLIYTKTTGLDLDSDDCKAPASWVKEDGEWKARTLYGPIGFDVAGDWPLQASRDEIQKFAEWKGGRLPTEAELKVFWEDENGSRPAGQLANIGFKNWHPIPPQSTHIDNAGQTLHGHNGGVWEWTSTVFDGLKGYEAGKLYPGYSADFFDGKHFVVLGGSYATVPNMAGRKSFRNWYQGNYRFSFIGGRVAYDV